LSIVKKRLEKQINTTYRLFKTINPKHFPDILKSHQKLDCKVNYDDEEKVVGFTIYDKSGYVLKSDEINHEIGIHQNLELFGSEYTQMNGESEQLKLELRRCIKEAYKSNFQNSGNKILFSEHIGRMPIKAIVIEMAKSERFKFFKSYLHTDNRSLGHLIKAQFDIAKDKLYITGSVKEEQQLKARAGIIQQAIDKQILA